MMKNPCHPGDILQDSFSPNGLGITVTEAARHLGVSRVTLSRVLNGRAAISADLALRLEKSGLGTARLWMAIQSAYDLSKASKRKQLSVKPFPTAKAA